VNLGVGENPSKRVEDPFEEELLKMLAATGATVMVDVGAPGSEEESRVRRAMDKAGECGGVLAEHRGPFASFAAMIAASRLYVGYDSAGQHVAAALGVPLISVFAGYPSLRMMQRWSPRGHGPGAIIPVKPGESWKVTLAEVGAAVQRLIAGDPC
jgi:ADP-heptose:LPS heptosyltransferase